MVDAAEATRVRQEVNEVMLRVAARPRSAGELVWWARLLAVAVRLEASAAR